MGRAGWAGVGLGRRDIPAHSQPSDRRKRNDWHAQTRHGQGLRMFPGAEHREGKSASKHSSNGDQRPRPRRPTPIAQCVRLPTPYFPPATVNKPRSDAAAIERRRGRVGLARLARA
jgi:hypothetical protein